MTFDARDGVFPEEAFGPEGTFDNPNWTRVAVTDGEKVDVLIYAPNRSGCRFDGWYLNGSPYNFNEPVTSDLTLVAQWEKTVDAPIVTAPAGRQLTYNGNAQELVKCGSVDGGVMRCAIGTDVEPTYSFQPEVARAIDAGTYYVWYGVEGSEGHLDIEPARVTATIAKARISPAVSIDGWTEGTKANMPVLADGSNPGAGDVVFEYAAKGATDWSAEPPTVAGAYTVRATVPETRNHLAGSARADFTVAPAPQPTETTVTFNAADDVAGDAAGGSDAQKRGNMAKVRGILLAKMRAKGKKSLVISWLKVKGVDGYDIFFSKCSHDGKKHTPKRAKTVKGNNMFKWTKGNLKAKTLYRASVRAYVLENGKKTYVRKNAPVYAFTSGGSASATNAKSVAVDKTSISLKKGRSHTIKATIKGLQKGKRIASVGRAPKLRYTSTNETIATVNSTGKIKAVRNGSCYVVVYAHNGITKKVKVTVHA